MIDVGFIRFSSHYLRNSEQKMRIERGSNPCLRIFSKSDAPLMMTPRECLLRELPLALKWTFTLGNIVLLIFLFFYALCVCLCQRYFPQSAYLIMYSKKLGKYQHAFSFIMVFVDVYNFIIMHLDGSRLECSAMLCYDNCRQRGPVDPSGCSAAVRA